MSENRKTAQHNKKILKHKNNRPISVLTILKLNVNVTGSLCHSLHRQIQIQNTAHNYVRVKQEFSNK